MRYCEISAKRKDSDHHDIIDLTAFNTDGFDVTGHKTLGESALFAGCPILLASEYYFAGFDIYCTVLPFSRNIWLIIRQFGCWQPFAERRKGNDANLDGNCRL